MKNEWTLEWTPHDRRVVTCIDDLDRLLSELEAVLQLEDGVLVTIENSQGASLAIGIGGDRSILNYAGPSKDPPYFTSIGEIDDDETVAFTFMGSESEFSRRNTIPNSLARDAAREFFRTGRKPTLVRWEMD